MTQTLRRIPFANIANFRDLGGYAAGDSGMTKWGVFYRSARLTEATPQELQALCDMGIRMVLDLRMRQEAALRPDAGMDDPVLGWKHLSLMGDFEADAEKFERDPDSVPPMSTLYRLMLEGNPQGFRTLMETLAEGVSRGAVLFHCTAGKDRTGLTAMFLQAICGVDRLDMVAHYQVSHTYNLDFLPGDTTGSAPETLLGTLDFLHKQYGGPLAYLRQAGVSQAVLDTLRDALWMPLNR